MSELIEQLTALEKRLFREQINLLVAMAKQPGEAPLAVADLSRIRCQLYASSLSIWL